jgi:prepilin-type processing-associated H-X9-DG protein
VNPDQTIGNLLEPYRKNYGILMSPGDAATVTERDNAMPVPSSSRPAYQKAQLDFNIALSADYGYNTQYYCVMNYCPSIGMIFFPQGTAQSAVNAPADSIFIANSIWDRVNGTPYGGGNWGADPPCRRTTAGVDTFPGLAAGCSGRWWWGGWNPGSPLAWNVFGGYWPWHGVTANVGWADGHATPRRISQLTAGCDVRNGWTGFIFDMNRYLWDLN